MSAKRTISDFFKLKSPTTEQPETVKSVTYSDSEEPCTSGTHLKKQKLQKELVFNKSSNSSGSEEDNENISVVAESNM